MTQQELDAVVVALDDALKIMARPTTAALRSRLGWSRQKTYEAIREAVRLGMIERVGVTKWTWFRMPFRREHEFRDRLHAAMYRAKERDEAQARVVDAALIHAELVRERDEARAEVERQRELKDYLRTWLSSEELEGLRVKAAEHPVLWEEIHHLKDEVKRLREALEASGEP